MKVKSFSHVQLFATPWTVAHQAPPSMGFSRQEYWSGLPFPSPGNLPDPGIEPRSPALQADAFTSEPPGKPSRSLLFICFICSNMSVLIPNFITLNVNQNPYQELPGMQLSSVPSLLVHLSDPSLLSVLLPCYSLFGDKDFAVPYSYEVPPSSHLVNSYLFFWFQINDPVFKEAFSSLLSQFPLLDVLTAISLFLLHSS